jgi:glucosamine 6-phosphate synthetase-like amidotransferase/phosphosugar isomerase protein
MQDGQRSSDRKSRIDVMCGIAGYSLSSDSGIARTLAAQALLAGIAERGADAVGFAYRLPRSGDAVVSKQRTGASELLESVTIAADATEALFHVRDYTKGHPSLAANNHPVRHGAVFGVHNGIIANDEEIFAAHGFERADPGMTVDSEAIFALVEEIPDAPAALEELYGSMATAWLDERVPERVFAARGVGRPLWLGEGEHEIVFASTREALELVEQYLSVRLATREVPEGTFLALASGSIAVRTAFKPDRSFSEARRLPDVRAPEERRSCLERLAALAGAQPAFGAAARAR